METRKPNSPPEPPAKAVHSGPIPLADRRRLVRPAAKPESRVRIITDWASI